MSGYFGTPDDLTDDMSDEVKRIADGVLPGNREQMAETMKAYADALAKMTAAFEEFARRFVEQLQPLMAALEKLGQKIDRRHRAVAGARVSTAEQQPVRRSASSTGRGERTGGRCGVSHECWQRVMAAIRARRPRWPDSCGGAGGIRTPEACALRFSRQ
jgi:hypothetical protein